MIGTAHYMSPEQATGKQVTSASDIYSLGVIAFEMFAGRRPFEADTPVGISAAHVHSPVPPLPPVVPRGVADLIREALAKDPASRPASAEVFALRVRREMRDGRPAPTLTMPAATTATAVQPSPARTGGAVGGGMADPPEVRRTGTAALLTFLAVILLIAAGVWLFATVSGNDASSEDLPTSDTTATTEPPPSTTLATAPPASAAPVTAAPTTAAPTTAAPTTGPPATTVAATTAAPPVATAGQGPPPTLSPPTAAPTTAAPITAPPSTAAPVLDATPAIGPTDEEEAFAFVLSYYEQVAGGEYDETWPSLTQEFRDARNLTYEDYTRYWRNTSLELSDLQFTPGPGPNEGRVRFAARYDTFGRIVEETDELTLRRELDGRLVITQQRIV